METNYNLPDIVINKVVKKPCFKFYVTEMIGDKHLLDILVLSWLNYTDVYPSTNMGSQLIRYNTNQKIHVVSFEEWKQAVGLKDWISHITFRKTLLKLFRYENLRELAKTGLLTDKRCKVYDNTKHKTIEDIDASIERNSVTRRNDNVPRGDAPPGNASLNIEASGSKDLQSGSGTVDNTTNLKKINKICASLDKADDEFIRSSESPETSNEKKRKKKENDFDSDWLIWHADLPHGGSKGCNESASDKRRKLNNVMDEQIQSLKFKLK